MVKLIGTPKWLKLQEKEKKRRYDPIVILRYSKSSYQLTIINLEWFGDGLVQIFFLTQFKF